MLHSPKVCIIAEAGVNHNGSLELALELVRVAATCGSDIVKFQTFNTKQLTTEHAKQARYQEANIGYQESQSSMLAKLELSDSDHFRLHEECTKLGIEFLSTPFDLMSLQFLCREGLVKRLKIPSGELTNLPFLLAASRTELPLILSTGMATLGEIEQALMCIAFGLTSEAGIPTREKMLSAYVSESGQSMLAKKVTILHCTTEYPAPFSDINLKVISSFRQAFPCSIGYSDHTQGIAIPIAATALGACLIEKHFTLDRKLDGPDHKASLEPSELMHMVQGIRQVEQAMGSPIKTPNTSEIENRTAARKSLVAACTIEAGDTFTSENLACKRPGFGIAPDQYWEHLGKKAARKFQADELIDLGDN